MMNELPKGWKREKVSSVAELFRGINYTKDVASNNPFKEGLPILRGNNINGELNFDDLVYVPKALIKKEQFIKKDDIIFAMSSGSKHLVGKSAVAKKDFNGSYGAFCALLRISDDVNKKYVSYIFKGNSYRKLISEIAKGTNINNLKREHILDFELPLPPKPTQQAIVSKIEELFSELDKGIENLHLAQQQLKTYRQSVLKWAFEGKLSERKSEWKNVRLGDVANAIDPQPSHRTPPIVQNGVPFVSIKDFDSELDKIDFTHARRVSPSVLKEHLERYKLEIGDFVIGKIGTIGKPVRIVLPQDYCLSANIVLIQPRKISTTYLYYFFQSNLIEKAFTEGMKATSQPAFGIQKVRELRIELPDEIEQYKIGQEIESRLSVADKMEESITQSLQQAEALRQSILKKAFEGRLI